MKPERYLCNLIVAGFAKCGTSSFHEYLAQHPTISMSTQKEPHHFSFPKRLEGGSESHNKLFLDETINSSIFGESSTTYSVWEPAMKAIHASLPDVKVIVLFREPVSRLISHYQWMFRLGLESNSICEAVRLEQERRHDILVHREWNYPWYLRCSNYAKYSPMMINIFRPENTLFIKSDSLADHPEIVFKEVFDFLGVPQVRICTDVRYNVTEEKPASLPLYRKELYERLPKWIRYLVRKTGVNHVGRRVFSKVCEPIEARTEEIRLIETLLEADIDFFHRQPPCAMGTLLNI